MSEPITAKYQFNVPSQPDPPTVREVDRNWAELEWDVPASNGGSRILGYNLQYRLEIIFSFNNLSCYFLETLTPINGSQQIENFAKIPDSALLICVIWENLNSELLLRMQLDGVGHQVHLNEFNYVRDSDP
jgi:hypothetical protein